jgi:predicted nucleotidyltransferase component of viral defense system
MKLHENKSLYTDAIRFTAQQMNLPPEYIEKDYWVTFALYNIFKNEIGKETVFKGGTALSKCFGLIQRFSEDIDLVVFRKESETSNQLKRILPPQKPLKSHIIIILYKKKLYFVATK